MCYCLSIFLSSPPLSVTSSLLPSPLSLRQQSKYKGMNKDQWYNVLEFSRTINTDLSNYDEDGACEYTSISLTTTGPHWGFSEKMAPRNEWHILEKWMVLEAWGLKMDLYFCVKGLHSIYGGYMHSWHRNCFLHHVSDGGRIVDSEDDMKQVGKRSI